MIATKSGEELSRVMFVRSRLQRQAGKNRAHGHTEGFSQQACAELMRVPEAAVLNIVRALIDTGWLSAELQIVDWTTRQPDKEDPTAAQRQRNKRRKDAAAERAKLGVATEADLELLTARERHVYAEIASRSRVTAEPAHEPKPEMIAPFRPIVAKEDTHAAREIAARENHEHARRWLIGDATTVHGYGTASKIVAQNWRCTRMSADAMIRQWLEQMLKEAAPLATFISGPFEQGLTAESYQRVVEGSIARFVEERTTGPKLPFGLAVQNGGRRA